MNELPEVRICKCMWCEDCGADNDNLDDCFYCDKPTTQMKECLGECYEKSKIKIEVRSVSKIVIGGENDT